MKFKRAFILMGLLLLAFVLGVWIYRQTGNFRQRPNKVVIPVKKPWKDTVKTPTDNPRSQIVDDVKRTHYMRALGFINNNLLDSLRLELNYLTVLDPYESDDMIIRAISQNNIAMAVELVKRYKVSAGFSNRLNWHGNCRIEKDINLQTFRFIIAAGLYRFQDTNDSILSLVSAIEYANNELTNYWLKNGCAKYLDTSIVVHPGECFDEHFSALTMAISKCDTQLVRRFMRMGVPVSPDDFFYADSQCKKFMYKVLVNELHYPISKVLSTHLHGCANDGDLPGVKILLELGAQINEPESTNRTPIFYAINQDFCGPSIREPNKFEVLKFLVKSGADINHQDKDGITPLMFSTKDFGTYGVIPKLYIARYLLSQNASTMLKDHQGKTFWDHILLNRNIAFIDFFIKDERTPEEVRRKFEMFAKNITPAQRKLWEREVDGLQDSYE